MVGHRNTSKTPRGLPSLQHPLHTWDTNDTNEGRENNQQIDKTQIFKNQTDQRNH